MSSEADTLNRTDTGIAASKVSYCSAPAWAEQKDFDPSIVRSDGEAMTRLLIDEQHDVASKTMYLHTADRLENMQAVQALSQWQLDFDSSSQAIQIHSLRIYRDTTVKECANPENARILQREDNLKSFILNGEYTVLILLEDIRPGDIIESCYSRYYSPQLLPDSFSILHQIPRSFQIGSAHLSIRFPQDRHLKWQGGPNDPASVVLESDTTTQWKWEQQHLKRIKEEPNIPSSVQPTSWIQISELTQWSDLAEAATSAWPSAHDQAVISAQIEQLCDPSESLEANAEKLVRNLQDDYRYLSVNTEDGGHVPAAPEVVIQRRYGDCKDLSLLLSTLLNAIGVNASPLLVNHEIGTTLADLSPSPGLFNHAIVTYEIDGITRWVDPTIPQQGGGIHNRALPDYHFGLSLAANTTNLTPQPSPPAHQNSLTVHDTMMLNSAGNHNILRVQTIASGHFADNFRSQLADEGAMGFAESSKTRHQDRYETSGELAPVEYEDDRSENIWRMVEAYKIPALKNPIGKVFEIDLPPSIVQTAIPLPENEKRHFPYAIPPRLHLTHIQEIRSKSFGRQSPRQKTFKSHGVNYSLKTELKKKVWVHTTSLDTETDRIATDKISSFHEMMVDMLSKTNVRISCSWGHIRMHREPNFFKLPICEAPQKTIIKSDDQPPPTRPRQRIASHPKFKRSHSEKPKRRSSSRSRHKEEEDPEGDYRKLVSIGSFILFTILIILKFILTNG